MRIIASFILIALLTAPAVGAQKSTTYVGVITDTMCGRSHKAMNIPSDAQCVRECVGDGTTYKYALAAAKGIYTLSDQETPAKFAGERVKVTGVLYPKTNILKVERIEKAR